MSDQSAEELERLRAQITALTSELAASQHDLEGFAHTLGFSERTRHRFEVRMQVLAGRRLADLDITARAANARRGHAGAPAKPRGKP